MAHENIPNHSECTGDCCVCHKQEPNTPIASVLRNLEEQEKGRHYCAPPSTALSAFMRRLRAGQEK